MYIVCGGIGTVNEKRKMRNTTLCYLEQDGKYLMLHRTKKENDANKDKWIGIGGKFEDKESPEDCNLREFVEETGYHLTEYQYRGIVTFISDKWETEYMHLFTASGYEGTPVVCDEGELEWIEKERLRSFPMWEGDRIFLDLLDMDIPFFSMKVVYEGEILKAAEINGHVLRLPYEGAEVLKEIGPKGTLKYNCF